VSELGEERHPCEVLSFNDKYMMLFYDRRYVTLKSRHKSCIPRELWDRDFLKFSSSGCIYCNGEFDDLVPRTLSLSVAPSSQRSPARWVAEGRKKQQTLRGWRVQKPVYRKVREISPDNIHECCLREVG
jgi:hypothetical protein